MIFFACIFFVTRGKCEKSGIIKKQPYFVDCDLIPNLAIVMKPDRKIESSPFMEIRVCI